MRTQADGEVIRRLRDSRGLTLSALAKLADISPAHVCRMESGHRHGSFAMRRKLADALGVDIADISKAVPRKPAA